MRQTESVGIGIFLTVVISNKNQCKLGQKSDKNPGPKTAGAAAPDLHGRKQMVESGFPKVRARRETVVPSITEGTERGSAPERRT